MYMDKVGNDKPVNADQSQQAEEKEKTKKWGGGVEAGEDKKGRR